MGINRRKRKVTFLKKLLVPVLLLMLAQALLIVLFMKFFVIRHTDSNAFDILNERVINRELYLENEMIHKWSNIQESETQILQTISGVLDENQASYADIKTDTQLNAKIIERTAQEVIYLLRKNSVTGAFIVLDGAAVKEGSSNAGFYVRDFDPANYSNDNADLLLERGFPKIAKDLNIPFDSYWKSFFAFSENQMEKDNLFYYKPLVAAQTYGKSESKNYGYWSPLFSLSGSDGNIITYSIPLMAEDGTVIGVLGVEVAERYMQSMLNYSEIDETKNGVYVLGITEDGGKTVQCVCSSGPAYQRYFNNAATLNLEKHVHDNIYEVKTSEENGETVYASFQPIKCYDVNTPFEKQQWVLLGIVRSDNLLDFSGKLHTMSTIFALLLMIFGLIVCAIGSSVLTRPIQNLVKQLRSSSTNQPIVLKKINIDEIDRLTEAIEVLSHEVAESASKISTIIKLSQITLGVFEYQKGSDVVFCSNNLFKVLGWEINTNADIYMERAAFKKKMDILFQQRYDGENLIYKIESKPDAERWVRLTYLEDAQKYLGTVSDITKDMQEKLQMERDRNYDLLTDLYNRRAFMERLENLFQSGPSIMKISAFIMWDLDNLKYINDTYGHDCGDEYIRILADCLKGFEQYGALVSRRSGDEFYVFLYGFDNKQQIYQIIDQVHEEIESSYLPLPNGERFKIRVSAGIAWYPQDAQDYATLIRYADFAMYCVKHNQKGTTMEFDKEFYKKNEILVSGQEALNNLIDKRLVQYAFQTIYDIGSSKVYGYEMLMRSMSSAFYSPNDVLRMARAESKLYEIEKLTLQYSMETFVNGIQSGKVGKEERVFINSIGNQVMRRLDIQAFEREYGEYLDRVVLEITETDQCDPEFLIDKVKIVKGWKGQIAIDDYGTGYNSQGIMMFVAPDIVKIDMSIIRDIDKDSNRQNVFSSLVAYAKSKQVKILAEGVETFEEMDYLVKKGVDYMQGYYIGKPGLEIQPVPPKVIEAIKAARKVYELNEDNKEV